MSHGFRKLRGGWCLESGAHDIYHLYPVRLADRDTAAAVLAERGISTGVHYSPAVHEQPPFAAAARADDLSRAEAWAASELSLPMFAGIDVSEIVLVCETLAEGILEPAARTP